MVRFESVTRRPAARAPLPAIFYAAAKEHRGSDGYCAA